MSRVAMSDMPKFYEKVFQYRFSEEAGALRVIPLGKYHYSRAF